MFLFIAVYYLSIVVYACKNSYSYNYVTMQYRVPSSNFVHYIQNLIYFTCTDTSNQETGVVIRLNIIAISFTK